jgi:hypothetical protein
VFSNEANSGGGEHNSADPATAEIMIHPRRNRHGMAKFPEWGRDGS